MEGWIDGWMECSTLAKRVCVHWNGLKLKMQMQIQTM